MNRCPICGNGSDSYTIAAENLQFLTNLAKEKKIDPALSMTRMIWTNIPKIGLAADTKEIVDDLANTLIEKTQEQITTILAPMKIFIETFPKIIESLPDDIRTDVRKEFQETRIRIETQFKTLRESTPTLKDTLNAMQAITDKLHETTERHMQSIKTELTEKFKGALATMGFPEPEQMKLLSQLIPATLPLLEELLRFQKVPHEKGKQGELELIGLLREYFPEDDSNYIGKPGDTDVIAKPRFNGLSLDQRILIESKRNNGWHRSFIQEVRKHMKLRGISFAILALDSMPKGSNGFMFELAVEGVILITSRDNFTISYGAIRSALITLRLFRHNNIDLHRLFSDQRITEAINKAYGYSEFIKRLRQRIQRIETNARGIQEEIDCLDQHLKKVLEELQTEINGAILRINGIEQDATLSNQQMEVPNNAT
jgi:hypothetical protein